ncbi:Na(+)-translocating NADH-quinone reductase subunit C, partial [uncultured Spongiibacter sp.]|uniref:Na(+)-translocating NADH-quinone reductase subunit C n=1 Tax=uncultured Spongiibacter sp. TaxID=870896 RepID=UPI002596E428
TVEEQFKKITTRIVNLEEGRFATEAELAEIKAAGLDPQKYDQRKASKTPELSKPLSGDEDPASIKRMEKYAEIYMIEKDGEIEKIILPIHGYGLWSTLYGFIALKGDMDTIVGLGFYSHAETPGLGGEVDNPKWKALWPGKEVYDDGQVAIELIKGSVDASTRNAENKVDGLSGATLTSRGVSNLVQFWMGDNGYKLFLKNLRAGEA